MASKNVTKKPSGLTIARKGKKFTFSWKIADSDYGAGQWLNYQVQGQKVQKKKIGVKATSYSITVTDYPKWVKFWVRGKRKAYTKDKVNYSPTVSEWVNKEWTAKIPSTPKIGYSRTATNAGRFTWTVSTSDSDTKPFVRVQYQTLTCKNTNDGVHHTWSNATTGTSTNPETGVTYTETSATAGYVRWFRVRSYGPAGYSPWVYRSHAYSMPKKPIILTATGSTVGAGTKITSKHKCPRDSQFPVDTVTTEYAIETPADNNLTVPGGAGWNEGFVGKPIGSDDTHVFNAPNAVTLDQCVYVRTAVLHDENTAYSDVLIAQKGRLTPPVLTSVSVADPASSSATAVAATVNAENQSDVNGSFLIIIYKNSAAPSTIVPVGIMPSGTTTKTVYIPYTSGVTSSVGVYAATGTYTNVVTGNDTTPSSVAVTPTMTSTRAWQSTSLPVAPADVVAQVVDEHIRVSWKWSWKQATSATLAWSDHEDAWESTDEPNVYEVTNKNATSWNIAAVETGKKYWVRIKLNRETDDGITEGPWCDPVEVDMSAPPAIPSIVISNSVITSDQSVTISWDYTSTDGTEQASAEVCEATIENDVITYGNILAHATDSHFVAITPEWETGTDHLVCVRVTSESGKTSDWSAPSGITVAEALEAAFTSTGLTLNEETGEYELRSMDAWSVTATGASTGGTTTIDIVRAEEYHIDRPDDGRFDGYEGEQIFSAQVIGETAVTIAYADLNGPLDDGATYDLVATVSDELGQRATVSQRFRVAWDTQPGLPEAQVNIDANDHIALIRVVAEDAATTTDTFDVYRLSADRPEKILEDGTFGTVYVDPYPAFGQLGGHRIVRKSKYGDYITADGRLAWLDLDREAGDYLDERGVIIDFGGQKLILPSNNTLDNSWSKDFSRTVYLGGSVHGSWNPGVTRDLTITCDSVKIRNYNKISVIRDLAEWAGICHVRTPDGSSFSADVQVSENRPYKGIAITYTFDIKKVDPDGFEAMTLEEWNALSSPEQEGEG